MVAPIDYFSEMNGVIVELTGTGDGKMFAFFNWMPPTVSEVEKATGQVITKMMPDVSVGTSLAFSHWGGRFYLFADKGIWKYDPVTGETTSIMNDVGFKIVGRKPLPTGGYRYRLGWYAPRRPDEPGFGLH